MQPRLRKLIDQIEAGPKGPRVGALFDLDRTLIKGYSAQDMLVEQVWRRQMSLGQLAESIRAAYAFGTGEIDFSEFVNRTAVEAAGRTHEENRELGRQLFGNRIARKIFPEAREIISAHRRMGHTLAVISSATPYQVEPVAADLEIPHVLCTELEYDDEGLCLGTVQEPACYGDGKLLAAQRLAASQDLELDASWFYSDSHEDLPLLEGVGHPIALNPNWRLASAARQERWPIVRFHSRSRASGPEIARATLAYGSTLIAGWAGVARWAQTGSVQEGRNVAAGVWADLAMMAINLRLDVSGEEHLWSHRPAVFVFNHQSALDAIVVAKLVRRDVTGIAKKEVKRQPIIGQLFQAGGIVFIDRGDREKAIAAMEPAVEALREGMSIAIAPEGTRSKTRALGSFKKGAFHLAIEGGVPMVPIVIHNTTDWMPKGAVVSKAGLVRVEVLPPVDTSKWQKKTIDGHVEEVRNLFVETLGEAAQESVDGAEFD